MTQSLPPPIPSLIPETAPFSEEQRVWLNGFFAGLVSLDGFGVTPLSGEQAAALLSGGTSGKDTDEDDGGAPWHDQTLPLAERMSLANGKPLRWRMMAAMAQQDCGQCGYDCKNYSGAIHSGKEERLNLCVPGGKETSADPQGLVRGIQERSCETRSSGCRTGAGSRRDAGPFARQSGRGRIRVAGTPEQAGIGEGNMAPRIRSVRMRFGLCRGGCIWTLSRE